jgi:hypothetical protein
MADNNFRNDRGRDPPARDDSRQAASDPLAELARLIGQGDAYPEADRRDDYRGDHNARRSHEAAPAPSLDWAAEDPYAAHDSRADDRYAPPAAASHQSYAPQERGYEDEEPAGEGGRYFSGPAATFNGFGDETDAYDRDGQSMVLPARTSPGRAVAAPHDNDPHDEYDTDQPGYHGGESYAADEYYDEAPAPRRRNGLLVIVAVLALTVVGTAGAFGYRAMFGGSVLPTLPPIIKAGNGPNKIVPAYGDSQANNATQSGAAGSGSAENLVLREEQPVNIEPAKAAPRVVATIPIVTGQGSVSAGAGPPADAAVQNSPVPPAPSPPAPAPAAAAAPAPAPAPAAPSAPAPAEPKKIHTVTIKADQVGAPAALAAPPAARAQAHPSQAAPMPGAAATPPAGSSGPLSITPGSQGGAAAAAPPPQRARVATAPVAVASAGSVSGVQAGASSGGGYAVQITSQRTATEAQASFRELRAKFPNQLGGREPIIRRADLGEKGTFYRALVGPFPSTEQAAELCSGLKAAGGSCIVQRN